MTAINLPGQVELPIVVDHKKKLAELNEGPMSPHMRAFKIANLLKMYEHRPSSELWSKIQALSNEILKQPTKD